MSENKINEAIAEAAAEQMAGKKWYMSKTVWANLIAGGAIVVQMNFGFVISPELQILLLSVVNLSLRKFTNQPVVW